MIARDKLHKALHAGVQALDRPLGAGHQEFEFPESAERLARQIVARSRKAILEARLAAGEAREAGRSWEAGQLLRGLLEDTSNAWRERQAQVAGLVSAPSYVVAASPYRVDGPQDDPGRARREATLGRALERFAAAVPGGVGGVVEDVIALVLPVFADAADLPEVAADPERLMQSLGPRAVPLLAVGRLHPGMAGAARSLREALATVEIAMRLKRTGIVTYEEVIVWHLLAASPDLAADLAGTLDPVTRSGVVLTKGRLHMLRSYLAHGCSQARTARDLEIPTKTLAYRIDQLERDLGLRIEQHWCLFELALLAWDLRGGTRQGLAHGIGVRPRPVSREQSLPLLLLKANPEIALGIVELGVGRLLHVEPPNGELSKALAAYLEAGCHTTEAADALFIHRRTLLRQLSKIERATGRHLSHPPDRLLMELGVRALRLGMTSAASG